VRYLQRDRPGGEHPSPDGKWIHFVWGQDTTDPAKCHGIYKGFPILNGKSRKNLSFPLDKGREKH
jgi:hypothetical protein